MDIEKIVQEVLNELLNIQETGSKVGEQYKEHSRTQKLYIKEKKVSVENPINFETIKKAQQATPARIGIGRTGTRMRTNNYLDFRIDHAKAQDAVFKDVDESVLKKINLPILHSIASSQEEYLMNLDAGRKLDEFSAKWLKQNSDKGKQVQIVISDGLSSTGVSETVPDLLAALIQGLKLENVSYSSPIFVKRSRVRIQDEIANIVQSDLVISLIGERPGLATSQSISAYIVYQPDEYTVESDRTVFSNIHEGGVPPAEAGAYLAETISKMLRYKSSGVKFINLNE